MRERLKRLDNKLKRMDVGYSIDAICDLREVLREVLELLEIALPLEVDHD